MISVSNEVLLAVALWAGANALLMLALGLNVTRVRMRVGAGVGTGDDPVLERAIRAHGNNTEYVPMALVLLALAGATGSSATGVHVAGAGLLGARVLHAIGIQQLGQRLPPARVLGNVTTWAVFVWLGGTLIARALA